MPVPRLACPAYCAPWQVHARPSSKASAGCIQIQIQIHVKKITIVFADRATSHSPSSRLPSTEWNCKYTSCITEEIDMKMELCKPSNLFSPLLNVLLLHPQAAQITLYMLILILTNAHQRGSRRQKGGTS